MATSNLEAISATMRASQGINVALALRSALNGDLGALPPDLAADFAAWLDLLDPAFQIDTSGVDMPAFGVLRGLDGLRELWTRWIEEWEH